MFHRRVVMTPNPFVLGLLLFTVAVGPAKAQQQVTLADGTEIVGNVSFADANIVIDVDGVELSFPLSEVTRVSSAKAALQNSGELLLFRGLEALASGRENSEALGLLAEAYRQAPENPKVAYWFAWCLVESGDGTAASEIFRMQHEEITSAYPHLSKQLAERIKGRLALESMPNQLVKTIDAINAGAANLPPNRDSETFAAYFRLLDQNERPIAQSDFRVTTSGENQHLEGFADGYFLYTFSRRRTYGASSVKIYISKAGLEARQFEFRAKRNGVGDAGVFTVKRFGEEDLQEVALLVVNQNDKPIHGAVVNARPSSGGGYQQNQEAQKTGENGKTTFDLYPGKYSCSAAFSGYVSGSKSLTISATDRPLDLVTIKLFPQIKAQLKIEWRGALLAMNNPAAGAMGQTMTGEMNLATGKPSRHYGDANWINLRQKEANLNLHLQNYSYGYGRGIPGQQAPPFWVGVAKAGEGEPDKSPEELFEEIDLKKLDEMKEAKQLMELQTSVDQRGHLELPLNGKQGKIIVGTCSFRDNRTGQPMLIQFKAWIEKIK